MDRILDGSVDSTSLNGSSPTAADPAGGGENEPHLDQGQRDLTQAERENEHVSAPEEISGSERHGEATTSSTYASTSDENPTRTDIVSTSNTSSVQSSSRRDNSESSSRGHFHILDQSMNLENDDTMPHQTPAPPPKLYTPTEVSMNVTHNPSTAREQATTQRQEVEANTPLQIRSRSSRIERDIILPRWQSDAEVTYCPICRTQFNFFVRKHHCRKCGRVVCNSCSPHRITIPYQFIVQPPPAPSTSATTSGIGLDFSSSGDGLSLDERNGGMRVRLCNPCVPDPNTLPPQPSVNNWREAPPPTYYLSMGTRPYYFNEDTMHSLGRQSSSLPSSREREITGIRARGMSAASSLTANSRQQQLSESAHQAQPNINAGKQSINGNTRVQGQIPLRSGHPPAVSPTHQAQPRRHVDPPQSLSLHSMGSITNPQPHYRSLLDMSGSQPSQGSPTDNRSLPVIPRISEEDECPVCHKELPARTLPDFESLRAAHISQCIESQITAHSGRYVRPGAYTSQSQPPTTLTQSSSAADTQHLTPHINISTQSISSSIPHPPAIPVPLNQHNRMSAQPNFPTSQYPNTPEGRMAAREAQHAAVVFAALNANSPSPDGPGGRRTGMFPYKATEKDCIDDAECTICLEEFEVGVGMARLECLCRFHYKCIREWFVNHPGCCPVHQHDGYGF